MHATFAALLALAVIVTGSAVDKRAALDDCLASAGVPTDAQGSDDWKQDVAPYNLRLQFKPIGIAVPTTIKHIQDAVACAVKAGVKTNPKCGGHSYASFGLGGEDGHLTIEMDRMNKVVLDNTTGIAIIEGGSRLGHVAAELYAQGKRAFSHGTCPGVGVGGHSLHGGYGVSSHTKGLALDWMVEATVVLANSTIVTCSEKENPELFWAIRGAGSSMGVVASFKFNTFQVPDQVTFFAAPIRWTTQDKAVAGMKAIQAYVENDMPNELNMRLFVQRSFTNLEGMYYGDKAGLQAVLQPLLNKTGSTLALAQTGSWTDQLSHFGNGVALNQTHPYDMHETFYSSSLYTQALSDEQIQGFVNYWFSLGKTNTRDWYAQFDFHGGKTSAIANVSVDATAYAHRDYLFMINWYDRVDKGTYPSTGFPFLQDFVSNLTSTMNAGSWGQYINYPDSNLDQATAQTVYWGTHLGKLQKIKAAVDPQDVFHYPQGIVPAKS